ncbi:MAG: serine/threonine protein phosphatase [Planctomycetaceae bacterium]|nr:serine/threonine protein phosphatase [Planctomycetaceae bacterium]
MRTLAIGDIHGCVHALRALLDAVVLEHDDQVITLGDYVDRGPDSRGVLDLLIRLESECCLVPLLGNHDDMLLQASRGFYQTAYLEMGGLATLASYGGSGPEDIALIPDDHIAFLERCVDSYEIETHIFVHASYVAHLPMREQPALALRWESLRDDVPAPHHSGKVVIAGHTSQRNGEVLDLGHIKCIDTCCYGNGWLTALDVSTGQMWQANKAGVLRTNWLNGNGRFLPR